MLKRIIFYIIISLTGYSSFSQDHSIPFGRVKLADTTIAKKHSNPLTDSNGKLDLIDVGLHTMKLSGIRKPDTTALEPGRIHLSLIPGVGYSLQTGFAAVIMGVAGFNTSKMPDANQSSIESSFNYTQLKQILFPVQANIWLADNKYNIQADWRYLRFPQETYGLGGYSSLNNGYFINFSNIRAYTTVLREVAKDALLGIGYNMDYIWDMYEISPPKNTETDLEKYGYSNIQMASGLTLDFLYDTRRNSINPQGGNFVNITYRQNLVAMGSTTNWQSLIVDLRKFIPVPGTKSILAFWSYEWLTLGGNPPYVLLPNTGGDPYANTGRGYTEGRFRGKNMAYLESEYRFGITRNGFLGGVLFSNLESFSEQNTGQFARLYPGFGGGLRLQFNKFSRTNVCIDYGFGADGSNGFFINLGEVF